jgi:hypothetical protein
MTNQTQNTTTTLNDGTSIYLPGHGTAIHSDPSVHTKKNIMTQQQPQSNSVVIPIHYPSQQEEDNDDAASSTSSPPEWALLELNGELLSPIQLPDENSQRVLGGEGGAIELGLIQMQDEVCHCVLCLRNVTFNKRKNNTLPFLLPADLIYFSSSHNFRAFYASHYCIDTHYDFGNSSTQGQGGTIKRTLLHHGKTRQQLQRQQGK